MKYLFDKIGVATFIATITGIMYLWGWIFWANYYHEFGLRYNFATHSVERLLISGSYYLQVFVTRTALPTALVALIYIFARRPLVRAWRKRIPFRRRIPVLRWIVRFKSPQARWIWVPLVICVALSLFEYSMNYVRADARDDAKKRTQSPRATVRVELADSSSGTIPPDAQLEIFEYQNKFYYFFNRTANDGRGELIVIPDSHIRSLTITENKGK